MFWGRGGDYRRAAPGGRGGLLWTCLPGTRPGTGVAKRAQCAYVWVGVRARLCVAHLLCPPLPSLCPSPVPPPPSLPVPVPSPPPPPFPPAAKPVLGTKNIAFMHGPEHKNLRKSFLGLFTRKALAVYVLQQVRYSRAVREAVRHGTGRAGPCAAAHLCRGMPTGASPACLLPHAQGRAGDRQAYRHAAQVLCHHPRSAVPQRPSPITKLAAACAADHDHAHTQDAIIEKHLQRWMAIEGPREVRPFIRDLNAFTSQVGYGGSRSR